MTLTGSQIERVAGAIQHAYDRDGLRRHRARLYG